MCIELSSCRDILACAVASADDASHPPRRSPGMNTPGATPPPDERQLVDARLLQRVAQGDQQAFADLYDRFSTPLYATALRIVRDSAEAQDIVHDVFVTVWDKAAGFESERGSAFSWIVTLVRNRAIDRVRSRRRRAELLAESAPADLGYQENPPTGSGSETATANDEARAVRAAVATLPAEQRRALELAFFSGLTQEQIAEKLSEPLGTIKARIRRALLKLRDSLPTRL
ncbi:MAG TPA: sigma-70 family RNA polymerase sigma factor [Opitutaceae bacterium]|nr:sigma-70 family RNA polymerase sigma factor [Opitutaceae bacterium]